MSGIYIPGMEMPLEGEYHMTLYVCSDGSAYIDVASFPVDKDRFEAVPVPEHGRTIDADAFKKRMMQGAIDARQDALTDEIWRHILDAAKSLCLDVDEQPTVIPADKEEEG